MGLVDDLLLPPVADGVRSAGAEDPAKLLCMTKQDTPAGDEVGQDPCGLLVHARVRLDLAVYELPREQRRALVSQNLLCPVSELEGPRGSEPQLLFRAQGALPYAPLEGVLSYERGLVAGVQRSPLRISDSSV